MVKESILKGECNKKKIQGFPHVFTLEIFKTAFMGDIKQCLGGHHHRRLLYRRRHRRSGSKVKRKM
jgi:hypothetical protein